MGTPDLIYTGLCVFYIVPQSTQGMVRMAKLSRDRPELRIILKLR